MLALPEAEIHEQLSTLVPRKVVSPKDTLRYDDLRSNCFSNEMLAEVVQPSVGVEANFIDARRGIALLNDDVRYTANLNAITGSPKFILESRVSPQNESLRMGTFAKQYNLANLHSKLPSRMFQHKKNRSATADAEVQRFNFR